MSAQKVLFAALTGVAVGLLIAPAKGSETRQKISDSAESIKKKIRKLRGLTSDELDDLKQVFEHEVYGLQDDVRERVLRLIEASRGSFHHVREEALS